ncbi:MAG: gliding motility protein GldN [Bacteroidia bacterium]|nr:gliding motility protein GldN [Bacteroidia bacterium]
MKKLFLIFTLILVIAASENLLNAQNVIKDAYTKRTTLERKPAPLPAVRESDAVWSRTVWRIIDLREKTNQHFYYPTREIQGRANLFNVLLKGIEAKTITAFNAKAADEEFKEPITYNQVKQQFGDSVKTIKVTDINTGDVHDSIVQADIPTHEVKQLEIKEVWYFDKQKSTLQVRILGICPIRVYKKDLKDSTFVRKRLFWVNYPEIRPLLAKNESLNEFNGARSLSFDDLFLTRRFDGYIVKEENTYNNRAIEQYATGEYAAKESERIKNSIFNYEQDLWEY